MAPVKSEDEDVAESFCSTDSQLSEPRTRRPELPMKQMTSAFFPFAKADSMREASGFTVKNTFIDYCQYGDSESDESPCHSSPPLRRNHSAPPSPTRRRSPVEEDHRAGERGCDSSQEEEDDGQDDIPSYCWTGGRRMTTESYESPPESPRSLDLQTQQTPEQPSLAMVAAEGGSWSWTPQLPPSFLQSHQSARERLAAEGSRIQVACLDRMKDRPRLGDFNKVDLQPGTCAPMALEDGAVQGWSHAPPAGEVAAMPPPPPAAAGEWQGSEGQEAAGRDASLSRSGFAGAGSQAFEPCGLAASEGFQRDVIEPTAAPSSGPSSRLSRRERIQGGGRRQSEKATYATTDSTSMTSKGNDHSFRPPPGTWSASQMQHQQPAMLPEEPPVERQGSGDLWSRGQQRLNELRAKGRVTQAEAAQAPPLAGGGPGGGGGGGGGRRGSDAGRTAKAHRNEARRGSGAAPGAAPPSIPSWLGGNGELPAPATGEAVAPAMPPGQHKGHHSPRGQNNRGRNNGQQGGFGGGQQQQNYHQQFAGLAQQGGANYSCQRPVAANNSGQGAPAWSESMRAGGSSLSRRGSNGSNVNASRFASNEVGRGVAPR